MSSLAVLNPGFTRFGTRIWLATIIAQRARGRARIDLAIDPTNLLDSDRDQSVAAGGVVRSQVLAPGLWTSTTALTTSSIAVIQSSGRVRLHYLHEKLLTSRSRRINPSLHQRRDVSLRLLIRNQPWFLPPSIVDRYSATDKETYLAPIAVQYALATHTLVSAHVLKS